MSTVDPLLLVGCKAREMVKWSGRVNSLSITISLVRNLTNSRQVRDRCQTGEVLTCDEWTLSTSLRNCQRLEF
jgi:hypothetical protein